MNIEQIKQDQENGVSVSKETYRKLVEAVLLMKDAFRAIEAYSNEGLSCQICEETIAKVEAL